MIHFHQSQKTSLNLRSLMNWIAESLEVRKPPLRPRRREVLLVWDRRLVGQEIIRITLVTITGMPTTIIDHTMVIGITVGIPMAVRPRLLRHAKSESRPGPVGMIDPTQDTQILDRMEITVMTPEVLTEGMGIALAADLRLLISTLTSPATTTTTGESTSGRQETEMIGLGMTDLVMIGQGTTGLEMIDRDQGTRD